ncbi:MAG: acyl-CoA dehydrogenase family protein [Candidatus Zixiibacteriota bacterium]
MPYNIDPRQQPIRDEVRQFCEKEILPVARELDRRPEPQKFPYELFRKLGKAGYIGYFQPKEYGGQGKSALEYATLIEELAYWDAPTSLLPAVSELAMHPITAFGSEEQKKKYLPKAITGETVIAFSLTEPEAGSDAGNQKTTAISKGDHYILNGEKIFIMHGDVSTVSVVFCKIAEEGSESSRMSALIVETDKLEGYSAKTLEYKMGMKAATTGRQWFKNCKVPASALLGERGKGFRYALGTLDGARIDVAAQGAGIARRALDESIAYARKRVCFGAPIAKLQAIQWMIADMATRVEAATLLTYKAAQIADSGQKFTIEASQAKLYGTETAKFCVDRGMQIHGGYGYIGEFTIMEKLYRDQRLTEIYEGTSEIQRLVIAGHYLGGR